MGTYSGTTCTTGRLASVTLPTGGEITYTYSGGNNGVLPDGSVATLTRVTPDGSWTFAQVKGTSPASTTTVTDPQSNVSTIKFQGIYETQRVVKNSSGSTLLTTNTCYNAAASPCTGTAITLPITQRNVSNLLAGTSNLTDLHVQTYDNYGNLLTQVDYDYGSGSHGSLLDTTTISYASLTNIAAFQQQVTVTNSAGTTVAKTYYNYGDTVTATSGTPQHTTPPGSRGNVLSVNYYTVGSTDLTKSYSYFDTGNVDVATDVNNAQNAYTYGACGNSFPTAVSEPLSLSRSYTYDSSCFGGVMESVKDENSQTASIGYTDPYYWRPNTTTDQLGNPTTSWYQPNPTYCCPSGVAWFLTFNSNNSQSSNIQYEDGLGRVNITQRAQSPGSSSADTVSNTFDANGRPYSVSVPCSVAAATNCPATPSTKTTYDALNRVAQVTDGGGGQTTYSYTNNDVTVTVNAPSGENPKTRQLEYNSIGQLTSVCEVTAGTSAWPGGNCAQTTAKTGYWTKYTYSPLGQMTGVTQNAQQTSKTQTRAYAYDLMGRLTSETNPESVTTNYVYDTNSTCGTYNGDLVSKTDANGAQTCYHYDALHRLTDVLANTIGGSGCKRFRYDNTTGVLGTVPSGISLNYSLGRLAEAETDTCASPITSSTMITDEWFSYDQRGETTNFWESTPHSGGYYEVAASYWANGAVNKITSNLTGLPTITYNADGEGRPSTVSLPSGQNPVTATTYNVANEATAVTFGSNDSDVFTFDPNTFRMTQYQFNVGAQSDKGVLNWNSNGTLAGLTITDAINSSDSQTCTFVHDDLIRLTSANCTSSPVWQQTYSYDPFGNIQQSGSMSFLPAYTITTNRISTIGSSSATYDSDGNVTNDTLHSFAWNQYGRPTTIDSVTVTYDAMNRVVEQNSGSYSQTVYDPLGKKRAIMSGQTFVLAFIPLTNGSVAEYWSGGTMFYRHPDWLGDSRLVSSTAQTVRYDGAYSPFGVPYATSGTNDFSFTGMDQDIAANLYDFSAREYEYSGRWPSPDPAGLAAVDPTNPQSWNRYAYVNNNPLRYVDPTGMDQSSDCYWYGNCSALFGPGGAGGSSYGGGPSGCTLDGAPVSCGSLSGPGGLGSNGIAACSGPCSGFNGNGQFVQFVAGAGGATGYVPLSNILQGIYESNGSFYSAGQFNDQVIDPGVEAQRQTLAEAISLASNSPDGSNWDAIYNALNPYNVSGSLQIQGGNVDFGWEGDPSLLSFVPSSAWLAGGCELACRYGSMGAIHFNYNMFHLDTASPTWGFGLGLLMHGFGDVFLGNINPGVPMVP